MQKQIEQDDKAFRSGDIVDEELSEKELDREEVQVDKVLEKLFKDTLNPIASDMAISVVEAVEKFNIFQGSVLDKLSDINSNLEKLVKTDQDRADLLRDVQNGDGN